MLSRCLPLLLSWSLTSYLLNDSFTHSHFTPPLIHTHTSHPHSFTHTSHPHSSHTSHPHSFTHTSHPHSSHPHSFTLWTITHSRSHFTPSLIHTHTSHPHHSLIMVIPLAFTPSLSALTPHPSPSTFHPLTGSGGSGGRRGGLVEREDGRQRRTLSK